MNCSDFTCRETKRQRSDQKLILSALLVLAVGVSRVSAVDFGSSNAPAAPPTSPSTSPDSASGTVGSQQLSIEPFTVELRSYDKDTDADPKYVEEDHRINQQDIEQAYGTYLATASETYASTCRILGNDRTACRQALFSYQTVLRLAKAAYDKIKLDDDIQYRASLAQSRKALADRLEQIREQEELIKSEKRKSIRDAIADKASEHIGTDASHMLDEYIRDSANPALRPMIAPEEYYPTRVETRKPVPRSPIRPTISENDRDIILNLCGTDSVLDSAGLYYTGRRNAIQDTTGSKVTKRSMSSRTVKSDNAGDKPRVARGPARSEEASLNRSTSSVGQLSKDSTRRRRLSN